MNQNEQTVRSLLTVAGTDPSGGAGIQVDLQVFRDFGYHGLSVVTALVWQNTTEVRGFEQTRPAVLREQLEAVFDDIPVRGIKLGMLPTPAVVETVADLLDERLGEEPCPVVLDPVLRSGTGESRLARWGAPEAMLARLLRHVDVVTPNRDELIALAGREIETGDEGAVAARELLEFGCGAVLFKMGHLADGDEISDALITDDQTTWLEPLSRVEADVRGTGCQLSSALVAALADGDDLVDAVERSRTYLNELLHNRRASVGAGRPVIVRTDSQS